MCLPVDGIGLNYHYGLFKQKFVNNKQTELPDVWITENHWQLARFMRSSEKDLSLWDAIGTTI